MISQFSGAVFDASRTYRFLAWRFWNEEPRVMFVGLNPSTADEYENDATIRRCLSFAEKWGYGGIYMCNIFAYRTTYPYTLAHCEAIHAANIPAITMASKLVVQTVLAWGDGVEQVNEGGLVANHIREIIAPSMCFGFTQKGNPRHPLYLPGDAELVDAGD